MIQTNNEYRTKKDRNLRSWWREPQTRRPTRGDSGAPLKKTLRKKAFRGFVESKTPVSEEDNETSRPRGPCLINMRAAPCVTAALRVISHKAEDRRIRAQKKRAPRVRVIDTPGDVTCGRYSRLSLYGNRRRIARLQLPYASHRGGSHFSYPMSMPCAGESNAHSFIRLSIRSRDANLTSADFVLSPALH